MSYSATSYHWNFRIRTTLSRTHRVDHVHYKRDLWWVKMQRQTRKCLKNFPFPAAVTVVALPVTHGAAQALRFNHHGLNSPGHCYALLCMLSCPSCS